MTTETNPTQEISQTSFFEEEVPIETLFTDDEVDLDDWRDLLDYEEPPLLLVDADPERAVARQKELMDTCFGGIGEEKKEEKRMGLAMQQLDLEQRHALRLLLIYQTPAELTSHLEHCLDDPAYGYGERGDQGRTIAQALIALAEDGNPANVAEAWLETHREFQQRVLSGIPMSFRSLFDYANLDSFVPVLQRMGDEVWRLGVEGEGQCRDFHGPMAKIWPEIGDTYVQWCDADNEAWLADLKRKATRLPDTILRAARADRLRKYIDRIEVQGNRVTLISTPDGQDWPRMMTMADAEGVGQLGLSRLSGHAFFELAWEGGLHVRRFEVSGTSRNKVKFEHIEIALLLAEALAVEYDLQPEPVTPDEVEAAYLRRMKAKGAELGPPGNIELPPGIKGQTAATYTVGNVVVTMLVGDEDFAYITVTESSEQAILLTRQEKRGVLMAVPVRRGRPRRGSPLMTTLLSELSNSAQWNRALCAWGAWLLTGL